MKLLINTQKVDQNDPVLGFFHRWIEEFSKHCEQIIVICLQKGEFNLPTNVRVLSLGKETGKSHLKYLWRFYKYIWRERKNYDKVFVHMNQEYVVLGGLWWCVMGKKVFLWRNHRVGNFLTRIAVWLADTVFYTSPQSFTAQFAKAKQMPVGVDTKMFCPDPNIKPKPRSILALGRISPVKKLEIFIETLLELQKRGEIFMATIVGSPISEIDKIYEHKLHNLAAPLLETGKLIFLPAVPHHETPAIYRAHEIYVNLTPPGSFDKTILEAMACGNLPALLPDRLTTEIKKLVSMSDREKQVIRLKNQTLVERHSLNQLFRTPFFFPVIE